MALEYWAKRQGEQGKKDATEKARKLLEQYGDVPLPTITLPSKEQQIEVPKFSQEALQGLEKEGNLIYELREKSIKSFKEQGKRFDSTWHRDFPQFEALKSIKSEVAINPNQLFLPNSNMQTFKQQEEMVKEFDEELSRRIPGVEAIIGEAADCIDLAFMHLDKTKGQEYLFGEKYHYYYTITKTPTETLFVATVGNFDARLGLDVKRLDRGAGANNVWILILIVPARTPSEKYSGTQA